LALLQTVATGLKFRVDTGPDLRVRFRNLHGRFRLALHVGVANRQDTMQEVAMWAGSKSDFLSPHRDCIREGPAIQQ
jgi:hypothetical protein